MSIPLFKKDKRAQVTLFVIIALVLVIGVVLFFSLNKKINLFGKELSAKESLESCIKNEMNTVDSILLRQGGISNPQNFLLVNGAKVSYLCYTEEYAKPCINQQPLLKENIENELIEVGFVNVSYCLNKEKKRLEDKGYSVSVSGLSKNNMDVSLLPDRILIEIDVDFTASKGDKTEKLSGIKTTIKSPAYEYAFLANKIINEEIRDGDFNNMLYMLLHRTISVDKVRSNDYTLYKLQNRNSNKVFIFLIRNYPIPAGL
jgi:hypothetical protein